MNRRVPNTPGIRDGRMPRKVTPISAAKSAAERAPIQHRMINGGRGLLERVFRAQSVEFYRLAGATGILVVVGLIMVLSSSSIDSLKSNGDPFFVFGRQTLFAVAGVGSMLLLSLVPVSWFAGKRNLIIAGAAGLQLLATIPGIGVSVNGNQNWIYVPVIGRIQPSEFLKLALIIALAAFMASQIDHIHDASRYAWPALIGSGVVVGLVLAGKDLGTAIVFTFIVLGMLWLSGAPRFVFRIPLAAAAVGVVVLVMSGGSRLARITAWLFPGDDDSSPYTWQSLHGIWALAAGRLTGAGLGQSKLKWSWIPEVENDYIFAVIGEEFGFIGAMVVICMFLFLISCLVKVLLRTRGFYERFIVSGVLVWIGAQSLINIAVVLQLLPVLGVPLPLISAGGSSLISSLLALGLVLSIERQNHLDGGRPARTLSSGTRVRSTGNSAPSRRNPAAPAPTSRRARVPNR